MSNMDVTNEYFSKVCQILLYTFQKYEIHLCNITFCLLTCPVWQLTPAIQVPSLLPVVIVIEMNWQGHLKALDRPDRKRENKGAGGDKGRGEYRKQVQQH